MLNLKCYVKLNNNWRTEIEAILIGFVPSPTRIRPIVGGELDTISTDCIVKLLTFDKDRLYQIPLELTRVVEQWDEKE